MLATIVLLPGVSWLMRRYPPNAPRPWLSLIVHAAATVPFSLIHVTLMGLIRSAVYAVAGGRYNGLGPLHNWLYEYRKDVLTYGSIAAFFWVWRQVRSPAPEPGMATPAEPLTLEVRDGARRTFVRPEDIHWIEAAGNYAELHLDGRSLLHRASLASLEAQLTPEGFVRIHRARLVNRASVASLATNPAGDFTVTLRGGAALVGSRRYRAGLTLSGAA